MVKARYVYFNFSPRDSLLFPHLKSLLVLQGNADSGVDHLWKEKSVTLKQET